jgi:hypothetical protein
LNFLKIYASQMGHCVGKKEELEEILESKATGECICIMGDFNAQTGKDRDGYQNIMWTHAEGERN